MNTPVTQLLDDKTRAETKILVGILTATFIVPVGFLIATVAFATLFPTTLITLILGVFVGVVIYVFVDPQTESKFALGGFTLGGAAAVIFLFPYLFSAQIDAEMNKAQRDAKLQKDNALLSGQLEKAQKKLEEISEITARGAQQGAQEMTATELAAAIKNASPDSELGRGVLALLQQRQGPFATTIEAPKAIATFNEGIPDGTFDYCKTKRSDLNGKVVFARVLDGDIVGTIETQAGQDIGQGICKEITYEVKLGCEAAKALLTEREIEGCDASRGILWKDGADKRVEMIVTLFNDQIAAP